MTIIQPQSPILRTVIYAGLLAGFLDGLAAVVLFMVRGGKNPVVIFNFIASGVFGEAGLKGGTGMALAGLFFHLVIATGWSLIYLNSCLKFPGILKNWRLSGLAYGIVVWLGMNLAVVPLSRTPPMTMSVSGVITGIVVLIFCVGLPVSYLAKRHFHA